jgi:glucokinase
MNNSSIDSYPRLVGDVGGTNARFAWQEQAGAPLSDMALYLCTAHESLRDAIAHYLKEHTKPTPAACGIGIATPITGDHVKMTNHDWSFSIRELRSQLGIPRVAVINDFTALALSLPLLQPADLKQIGGGRAIAGEPLAVLGAGTGLGVSGLMTAVDGAQAVVSGEGGHATLAANDDQEAAVIAVMRSRFGHVSAERALSGPGLVNLYQACATLSHRTVNMLSPSDVIFRARTEGDASCQEAIDLFCRFLGGVAGNLALTLGARGGVFVGGGIAPRLLPELNASRFRERFEEKGKFKDYLQPIPTFVIDPVNSPALTGASRALDIDRFCIFD